MKVKIELEFNSKEEAAAFLLGGPQANMCAREVEEKVAEAQQFEGKKESVQVAASGMSALEKARATKAANKAKKEAEAAGVMPTQSNIPTGAFPPQPSQPLSPIPAPPQGMPMPAGLGGQPAPINYGQPMQPAPQVQQPVYQAPVQQAPAQQAWDRNAVIGDIQARTAASGKAKADVQTMFSQIFAENQIAPAPVGQLGDQDLYKFLISFNQKILQGNPNHLA